MDGGQRLRAVGPVFERAGLPRKDTFTQVERHGADLIQQAAIVAVDARQITRL